MDRTTATLLSSDGSSYSSDGTTVAPPALEPHDVLADVFRIKRALGSGSFGSVYEAVDTRSGNVVAVKVEAGRARFPQLAIEARVLRDLQPHEGIPRFIWFGVDAAREIKVLVMQKLHSSLEAVRVKNGGTLPLTFVVALAPLALMRLRACHINSYAHRDIKPDNFMLVPRGAAALPELYLIDFGLSKRVADPVTRAHIANRRGKSMVGTPRYASLNAHDGCEQSRRDDVEALVFVLIYLVHGKLPWQGLARGDAADAAAAMRDDIGDAKRRCGIETLCTGLPAAFARTLEYARALKFEDMPDYDVLFGFWK